MPSYIDAQRPTLRYAFNILSFKKIQPFTPYIVAYIVGNTNNVSAVATNRPPAIDIAIGPQNTLAINGIIPKIAVSAVNMIGRNLITVDSITASYGVKPSCKCLSI